MFLGFIFEDDFGFFPAMGRRRTKEEAVAWLIDDGQGTPDC